MLPGPPSAKYARPEYERRFLLAGSPPVPAGIPLGPPQVITDRYVDGTRLRLRLVTSADGEVRQRKLGHKIRVAPDDPAAVWHTTLYLDDTEFSALAALPAAVLVKSRRACVIEGVTWAVDTFAGALTGLTLLEVECADPVARAAIVPPPWAGPEVTADDRFSGGHLARAAMLPAVDP